jgi:hypothetical protein
MATQSDAPDLILHSGLFTTLDRSNPTARAWLIFSESEGFPDWGEYDSRCWLERRPASDGASLFP